MIQFQLREHSYHKVSVPGVIQSVRIIANIDLVYCSSFACRTVLDYTYDTFAHGCRLVLVVSRISFSVKFGIFDLLLSYLCAIYNWRRGLVFFNSFVLPTSTLILFITILYLLPMLSWLMTVKYDDVWPVC